jgi:hypothetical protein
LQGLHGQKSIWHAHDLSWHTPRHAMGSPWLAMAHTKACHGSPWLAMAHTKAAHCKPWQPMGWPWHTQRLALAPHGTHQGMTGQAMACRGQPMGKPWHKPMHFLKKYLDFGRDILHTCLEKSNLQACQVLRFLKKKIYFFKFF